MIVSSALTPTFTPRFSFPTTQVSVPTATDLVTLSAPPSGGQTPEARRKMYRQLEWVGFGAEMVGGGMTIAGHGAYGLPIAIAGAALMVYAGWKRKQA